MPAISPANQLILRLPFQRVNHVTLNLFRKVERARADVNQVSFTYPLATLTVDNPSAEWTNAREYELIEIWDSTETTLKYTSAHRKNPDATTCYIDAVQSGSDQRNRFVAVPFANNDIIISYTVQIPVSFATMPDRTVTTPPIPIYKRVDIPWNTTYPQTVYVKPQPQLGSWQQAEVDDGTGKALFTYSAAGSYSLLGGSLSYEWILESGIDFVSPSVNTDETVDLEADPGQYIVTNRVQDDTAAVAANPPIKRGFRYAFANDATIYPAFNQQYRVTIESDEEVIEGREVNFTVHSAAGMQELFAGQPLLLTYDLEFSEDGETWVQLEDGLSRRSFSGYVENFEAIYADSDNVVGATFRALSPLLYFQNLPVANQYLKGVSGTPANWQEIPNTRADVGNGMYYTAEYHTSICQLHNVEIGDSTDFQRSLLPIPGGRITDALKKLAALGGVGYAACTPEGAIQFKRNPNLENTTYRDAIDTVWQWEDSDLGRRLEYKRRDVLNTQNLRGGFTVYNSGADDPYEGFFNQFAPAQGGDTPVESAFIALSEADGLARLGHLYQEKNSPVTEVPIDSKNLIGEFIRPADLEWHQLDVDAYDPKLTGLYSRRVIPLKTSRDWSDIANGVLRIKSTGKPETYGQSATRIDQPVAAGQGGLIPIPPSDEWCYTFNWVAAFTGWVVMSGFNGSYSPGVGFVNGVSPNGIETVLPADATITSVVVTFNNTAVANYSWSIRKDGTIMASSSGTNLAIGTHTGTWTGSQIFNATNKLQWRYNFDGAGGTFINTTIVIRGVGTNPFGSDNC